MGGGASAPDTIASASQSVGIAATPQNDPTIETELKRNFNLAGQLGATGTPLFVVGDQVMNGAVGYDALKDAIAKARAKS